jgi:hypothetical protein
VPDTLLAKDRFNHAIQALKPGNNVQVTVSTGGSNVMAANIDPSTVCVRLISTVDCRVTIGVSSAAVVTASAGSFLLPAGFPEYFRVDQAGGNAAPGGRVAAIAVAAAGLLDITPMV